MQSRSTLMAMLSPVNSAADVTALIRPLAALPSSASTEDAAGKVYVALLQGQPRLSIEYAVDRIVRGTKTFRPTPGQFAKIVLDHAKTIELKLAHLNEAIAAEAQP